MNKLKKTDVIVILFVLVCMIVGTFILRGIYAAYQIYNIYPAKVRVITKLYPVETSIKERIYSLDKKVLLVENRPHYKNVNKLVDYNTMGMVSYHQKRTLMELERFHSSTSSYLDSSYNHSLLVVSEIAPPQKFKIINKFYYCRTIHLESDSCPSMNRYEFFILQNINSNKLIEISKRNLELFFK